MVSGLDSISEELLAELLPSVTRNKRGKFILQREDQSQRKSDQTEPEYEDKDARAHERWMTDSY